MGVKLIAGFIRVFVRCLFINMNAHSLLHGTHVRVFRQVHLKISLIIAKRTKAFIDYLGGSRVAMCVCCQPRIGIKQCIIAANQYIQLCPTYQAKTPNRVHWNF